LVAVNGRYQSSAKAVAYECSVSGSTEKRLYHFPRNDRIVLLDTALHLLYKK